jgi:hypothetical protein
VHIAVGIFFLVAGLAMLVWRRRVTRAGVAANRTFIKTLDVPWMTRMAEASRAWNEPFYGFVMVFIAVIWIVVGVASLLS